MVEPRRAVPVGSLRPPSQPLTPRRGMLSVFNRGERVMLRKMLVAVGVVLVVVYFGVALGVVRS